MEEAPRQHPPLASNDSSRLQRRTRLSVSMASDLSTIEDAQRLRYKVFAEELGAELRSCDGLDVDEFDRYCDHLVVRDEATLRVVGTYRLLPPHQARRIGRLYSEGEFDLRRLHHLRPTTVELGRSCVHRDYRSGPALMLLWAGVVRYMKTHGCTHAVGCASVPLADGGRLAAYVRDAAQQHLVPLEYRAFPWLPFPHEAIERPVQAELPPLLRGYFRAGAMACGEPAWDPEFGTADLLVLISLANVDARYARRFDLAAPTAACEPA